MRCKIASWMTTELTMGGGRGAMDPLDLDMLEKAAFWSAIPSLSDPEKKNCEQIISLLE